MLTIVCTRSCLLFSGDHSGCKLKLQRGEQLHSGPCGLQRSKGTIWHHSASVLIGPKLSTPDVEGEYRHYLANDVKIMNGTDGSLSLSNGTVITYYAGPGPIAGTGAHRYSWLLFQQPESFTPPSNLSTSGVGPSHWDFPAYVAETGLGAPVAAQFFTVENGAP